MSGCPWQEAKNYLISSFSAPVEVVEIFVGCWRQASQWLASDITNSDVKNEQRRVEFLNCLEKNPADLSRVLIDYLRRASSEFEIRGVVLHVMTVIDEFFLRIHPRSLVSSGTNSFSVEIPRWIISLRQRRLESFSYWADDSSYLIPRGPLSRKNRGEFDASGESLSDRFSALSVVPRVGKVNEVPIAISIGVITSGIESGISVVKDAGYEDVAVIPVGRGKEHIAFEQRTVFSSQVARYSSSDKIDVVATVLSALQECGGVDVAVASEFFVDEEIADTLCERLHEVGIAPNLFVAGSGNTIDRKNDQSWNETRVVNSLGLELWRQRKIWPSGIDCKSADQYGMTGHGKSNVKEDNASSREISVVDIDGVGRCVVLICQDLQAATLAEDIVSHYQPDWVFTPILDTGVSAGRWGHQRSFALSSKSQARFVIVSSESLKRYWDETDECSCAMLVGPLDPKSKEQPKRAYALLNVDAQNLSSSVKWGGDDKRWCASNLGFKELN